MAQHLLISDKYVGETKHETKSIRQIVKDIRSDLREIRETDDVIAFESKYERLPDDYLEKGETEAYYRNVDVPESMVWGGRATIELHLKWSRISKIYLVA